MSRAGLKLEKLRFGMLVGVCRTARRTNSGDVIWRFLCDCGNLYYQAGSKIKTAQIYNCGCVDRTTHGKSKTVTYNRWADMKRRCNNKSRADYPNYGGRGITYIKRWEKFENFFIDMGECPKNLTLDRINVNDNYTSSNCRWATHKEQQNNRRNTRLISIGNGETKTIRQLADEYGLTMVCIRKRLNRGWKFPRIVNAPVREVHNGHQE